MSSLNNTLSIIYNNLYTFFEYKNLIPLEDKSNDTDFIKHIYNNEYFLINTISKDLVKDDQNMVTEIKDNLSNTNYKNTKNYKITYVILFHYNTEIYSKTQDFKKILNTLNKTPFLYNIIFITKNNISTHVNNFIKTINNKVDPRVKVSEVVCKTNHNICDCYKMNILTYTYKLFIIIIPKHILSNEHIILSKAETKHLLTNILYCKAVNLPKIKINDPQIIWSPGKIGDVVSIKRHDDISGLSLYYRVII